MPKLRIKADPNFLGKVGVPLADGSTVDVEMKFRHRTKSELRDFLKTTVKNAEGLQGEGSEGAQPSISDTEFFKMMVEGWELDEPFTDENITEFLENYHGAGVATFRAYLDCLMRVRQGN